MNSQPPSQPELLGFSNGSPAHPPNPSATNLIAASWRPDRKLRPVGNARIALALSLFSMVLGLAGCKSTSPSKYTSPRITGRVVDASTKQPIKGVIVRRLTPNQDPNVDQLIKGAERIDQSPAVRTDSAGDFALASEKNLAFFQRLGWYSVSVTFTHPRFERLTVEYTLVNATNTPTGEPWVSAGDIRLQPKPD